MPKLAPLALALLLLPHASAGPLPIEGTPALGLSVGDGTVEILASLKQAPGTAVPMCDDAETPPNGTILFGRLTGCFQPAQGSQSGTPCGPVIITLFPEGGGPVAAKPNQTCLDSLQDLIFDLIRPDELPGKVGLHIKT